MLVLIEVARAGSIDELVDRRSLRWNLVACLLIGLAEVLDAREHIAWIAKDVAHVMKEHERNAIAYPRKRRRRHS
jgi:hypothetical protein